MATNTQSHDVHSIGPLWQCHSHGPLTFVIFNFHKIRHEQCEQHLLKSQNWIYDDVSSVETIHFNRAVCACVYVLEMTTSRAPNWHIKCNTHTHTRTYNLRQEKIVKGVFFANTENVMKMRLFKWRAVGFVCFLKSDGSLYIATAEKKKTMEKSNIQFLWNKSFSCKRTDLKELNAFVSFGEHKPYTHTKLMLKLKWM